MSDDRRVETDADDSFGQGAAEEYDLMVDCDARLGRELPFFLEWFDSVGARRVADVGCGTGRHAVAFAQAGLEVLGIDPSEAMLEQAEIHAARAGVDLGLRVGGFGDVAAIVGDPVDGLVCLGNAFMHVGGGDGAREALADMAAALRPGGVLVLHFLNHDRLLTERPRMMPARFRDTPDGPRIFMRLMSYGQGTIDFEYLRLSRQPDGEWQTETRLSSHVVMPTASVVDALAGSGFHDIELLGAHDGTRFDPATHESVIMVARRAG